MYPCEDPILPQINNIVLKKTKKKFTSLPSGVDERILCIQCILGYMHCHRYDRNQTREPFVIKTAVFCTTVCFTHISMQYAKLQMICTIQTRDPTIYDRTTQNYRLCYVF